MSRKFSKALLAISFIPAALGFARLSLADSLASKPPSKSEVQMELPYDAPTPEGFNGTAALFVSNSFQASQDPNHFSYGEFDFFPNLDFGSGYRLEGRMVLIQGLQSGDYLGANRTDLSLRSPFLDLSGTANLAFMLRAMLPVDHARRHDQRYRGGVAVGPRLGFTGAGLGLESLSGTFEEVGMRLIHATDTSRFGDENQQYVLKSGLNLNYVISGPWSVSSILSHYTRWTVSGARTGMIEVDNSVTYQFSKALGTSIGVSNYPEYLGPLPSDGSSVAWDHGINVFYGGVSITY